MRISDWSSDVCSSDLSRWGNILEFNGFDLITPNEKEARFSLGDQDTVIRPLGTRLYEEACCKVLMLKLGARGLMTFRDAGGEPRSFFVVDSFADHVVDAVVSVDASSEEHTSEPQSPHRISFS